MSAMEKETPFERHAPGGMRRPIVGLAAMPGDRYSRRVAMLKRLLPGIGLILLLMIIIWPELSPLLERMRFTFPAIDLRDARELRMLNPRYAGTDRFGRPYVMTAAVGRQVPSRDDLMSFEHPRGDLTMHSGAHVVVTALTGVYQSPTQLLDLFDDVNMVRDDGSHFVTRSAHLDFTNNTGEGNDPVVGHGPSGDITAQGFRILDKGDTIVFTGASDLILTGARLAGAHADPPAVPVAVAETAATIEAAAPALLAAPKPAAKTGARATHATAPPVHPVAKAAAKKAP